MKIKRGRQIGINDFVDQMEAVMESISPHFMSEYHDHREDDHIEPSIEIAEREKNVLDLIRWKDFIPKGQVQQALKIKETNVWNLLKRMKAKGFVHSQGSGKSEGYLCLKVEV